MSWYIEVLKKYAQFDGRARRKEYWMFTLFNILIYFALALVGGMIGTLLTRGSDNPLAVMAFIVPAWIYILAVIVPGLAVSVRRLHDTGRSGWWILIGFVPFVGGIILLVFHCQDSQPGPNEFGPNPKQIQFFGQVPPPMPGY